MTQQERSSSPTEVGNVAKLSRKVHKADREKLRRDKLNEQFTELAAVLDPEKPKLDKASILGDSLQVLNDLRFEIKRLKKERGTLFDESRDLKREKCDLEEERATLQKQTDELSVQVEQLLNSLGGNNTNPTLKQQVDYPQGFQHMPLLNGNNPYLYLAPSPLVPLTPLSPRVPVERPSARYLQADTLPDFLSKVQSNSEPGVHSDVNEDIVELSLGQSLRGTKDRRPRQETNKEPREGSEQEDDTDLQLKI